MNKVKYTDYIVNVANALLEFDILKEGLKALGSDKITLQDLAIAKIIAEVSGITDDNMIAIFVLLMQVDKDDKLKKKMIDVLESNLYSLSEDVLKNKIQNSSDGLKIIYGLAVLDSYIEYLETGSLDESVLNKISRIVSIKMKVRSFNGLLNTIDFYEANKNLIQDKQYKEGMKHLLNNMTKEELVDELILTYRILSNIN